MDTFELKVKRARKGDSDAFAQLYAEIYIELFKYALFVLRNEQEAQDAVSEAVMDAYTTIGKLKNEGCFKSWMFKILSCKCKRQLKIRYKKQEEVRCDIPDEMFLETDTLMDVKNAMAALHDEERMIISLMIFGGYSSGEVSKILKLNRNTVRSKYSRSLEKIRVLVCPNTSEKGANNNE